MTTGLGAASKLKRGTSNGNSLCGGNSAGSREICATFQRDNLRRHFSVRIRPPQPRSRSLGRTRVVVTKVLGASLNYRMQPRRRRALKSGPVQTPKALLGIGGRASVTRFIHGCPKGLHQGSGFAIRGGAHQQYCEAQHPLCPVRCGRRNDYRFRDSLLHSGPRCGVHPLGGQA
jgi:hypothetical protein